MAANSKLTKVGFIFIKRSLPEKIVKPPKNPSSNAENKGILATFLVTIYNTTREISVETIRYKVAGIIGFALEENL